MVALSAPSPAPPTFPSHQLSAPAPSSASLGRNASSPVPPSLSSCKSAPCTTEDTLQGFQACGGPPESYHSSPLATLSAIARLPSPEASSPSPTSSSPPTSSRSSCPSSNFAHHAFAEEALEVSDGAASYRKYEPLYEVSLDEAMRALKALCNAE